MCKKLNIENNVQFLGFLPTQKDIHKLASCAKICVLPTLNDNLPGTIVESMFMKLPVIAYAVGGLPELNINETIVVLVEKNNVKALAFEIINLLNDNDKQFSLAEKAFNYAINRFNDSKLLYDIINIYQKILNN